MEIKFKPWHIFVGLNLVILNVISGYLIVKTSKAPVTSEPVTTVKTNYVDQCGLECQKYVASQIAQIEFPTPIIAPTTKPVIQTKTLAKPKIKSTSYITLSGSGSVTATDWVDVANTDFYFNTADYPGLVEIYFESNMKLFNGNGLAYVRLFDVTHGIGVQGSEVQTNSQTSTVITSGKVSFWAGKNLMRVQAKTLTADTAVFNSGRLQITTEN